MDTDLARLWPRAERILDEVLDLPEPARSERARRECAGDPELERAVLHLLRADLESGEFLAALPEGLLPREPGDGEPPPPERIGPFRVLGELGRGGMGAVLLAERDDGQFEQRVAIKLLHGGASAPAAREILLRERRILARLEHPHIARILDGGVTPEGDPYFVMERVDGSPIDEHAARAGAGVEDRLRLVLQACRGVEYAHGQFVVHCDLKPGNILVTDDGTVKVVDFGISRRLEELEGEPRLPHAGLRLLTPAFAAPEQVRGEAITAATDVYQLGGVLRLLLQGPGVPPPRRALAADLAAILDRALQPDPARRYPTAEALRRDLEDLLASRPVDARGGGRGYRARKYLGRHRVAVAAAALAAVSLLGGLLGVSVQARVAARERDRARAAEARAAAVNDFVVHELLRAPMPEASLGRDLTVAEVLRNASRSVDHALQGQPGTQAEVRLTLARTYASLGHLEEAGAHARAALALLTADPSAAASAREQAERTAAELALLEGAAHSAAGALEALHGRQVAARGPEDPGALETAAVLGRALTASGEYARAEQLLRASLAAARRAWPERWRLEIELARPLARALVLQSDAVEAEATARALLATLDQRLGEHHPERIEALTLLASSLTAGLRYAEAAAASAEAVEASRRIFGPRHPALAAALGEQALVLDRLARYDAALAAMDEAREIRESALGPDHPLTLQAEQGAGVLLGHAGRPAEGEVLVRRAVEARARVQGDSHPETIRAMQSWQRLLLALDRAGEARAVAERIGAAFEAATARPDADPEVLAAYGEFLLDVRSGDLQDPQRSQLLAERAVEATARRRYVPLRVLGDALDRSGRPAEAIAAWREVLALPDGRRSWSTEDRVVERLGEHGAPGDVEAFLRARLADLGPDDRMSAKTHRHLARHLDAQGRTAEAEASFRAAVDVLRRTVPAGNWEIGRALSDLGACLSRRGALREAELSLQEACTILVADGHSGRELALAEERLSGVRAARAR